MMNDRILQYIQQQGERHQPLLHHLAQAIHDLDERITCKIAFGVPFYYFQGPLCYLNCQPELVYIGIWHGPDLVELSENLAVKGRKLVASLDYVITLEPEAINNDELYRVLRAAMQNNAARKQKGTPRLSK
jgi:hypothetical protein